MQQKIAQREFETIEELPKWYSINFKSGDGESWVSCVLEIKDGTRLTPILNCTDNLYEALEHKYHHIIFKHDHDDDSGKGRIEVKNGIIINETYQVEY